MEVRDPGPLHECVFRLVCTFSGFIALAAAYTIVNDGPMDGASWAAAAGLFAIAIAGIGGQLSWLLLQGKVSKIGV